VGVGGLGVGEVIRGEGIGEGEGTRKVGVAVNRKVGVGGLGVGDVILGVADGVGLFADVGEILVGGP
jgi:hypothetical protein